MLWSCCLWSAFLFLLQLYFPASRAKKWQPTPLLRLVLAEAQVRDACPALSVFNIHFVFSGSVVLTPPPPLQRWPGRLGGSLPAEQFPESVLLQLDILFFIAGALFRQMFRSVCSSLFSMSTRLWEPQRTKFRQMKLVSCDSEYKQTTEGPDEGREFRMPYRERRCDLCTVVACRAFFMLLYHGAFSITWHANSWFHTLTFFFIKVLILVLDWQIIYFCVTGECCVTSAWFKILHM